ncbi:MAG TPA: S4 domain-containing protein [Candidatus Binatia bacterium]|jgi:ribosome-associated heat shock protein Hsp15
MAREAFAASVRLDKWLWAARFFKTRSLAADAVEGGKVHLNGNRTKRGHTVRMGDELKIRRGPYEWTVIVKSLSERRGPASEAQKLYEETDESKESREALATELRLQTPLGLGSEGRPSKKERRDILGFKRRGY